jgi:ribose transport system ATP-binding protein
VNPDGQAIRAGSGEPALAVRELSKAFGATQALDGVSFGVQDAQIHAVLGENGSGKSTFVKVLAGVCRADEGSIVVNKREVSAGDVTPANAQELGLRFVHQSPTVFATMTVAENMALGTEFPTQLGRIRWRELRKKTRLLLERYGIAATPDTLLGDLRSADQTMVAIARALRDSDESNDLVLVLDEPTAALPEQEVELLLATLRACSEIGQTIIYVSHRIEEVLSVADSVTVLRDGRHVITRSAAGLTEAELVSHIIGRQLTAMFPSGAPPATQDTTLEVSHLSGGPLRDVSFVARKGEIVGIAGLLGTGRTELLRMIFGAYPKDGGEIRLNGQLIEAGSPKAAMALGIGYVPEDRHQDAAYATMSVRENITIARLSQYWQRLRFHHRRERDESREYIGRFSIRTSSDKEPLSSLSGGNQQKVVLARWLSLNPTLLLLDEPTQGIDIGARADVYQFIRQAVDGGMTAILVSSDFEELARVADRVLILGRGRVGAELPTADLDRMRITELVYSMGDPA